MSKVNDLIDEDERYFGDCGGIKYYGVVIDDGYGGRLMDIEGKCYIDLLGSGSWENVGEGGKGVVEGIRKESE